MTAAPLLAVEDLSVAFRTRTGVVRAVEGVAWEIAAGETLGIVGESGSGKSVTAYAVMGLLDHAAEIRAGRIRFDGRDLLTLGDRAMRAIRGRRIAMIFQNPRAALNPIRTVGNQLADVLHHQGGLGRREAAARAVDYLAMVGIADPRRRLGAYPFELSGGMSQRVMIALALACAPDLLIADEPTTGLDVTTQAAVMDLIRTLTGERGLATVLITHDLALAAERCDRILVMHAGHVVETAPVADLFARPAHPYTRRLIAATPTEDGDVAALAAIPGGLPDLRRPDLPPCRYRDRCERALPECDVPPLPRVSLGPAHSVACRRAP